MARKRSHKQNRKLHAMNDTRGYAKKGGALGNAGILGNTAGPGSGDKGVTEERELTNEKHPRGLTKGDSSVTRDKGDREERLL